MHTELIIVSADIKFGDLKGESLPLKCKWFINSSEGL